MRTLIVAIAMLTAACATAEQAMERYMGQPVQAAMLNNGPPTNAFDLPDGQRAFQWIRQTESIAPTYVNRTTRPSGLSSTAWTTNAVITGGETVSDRCIYTIIARWDEARNAWIATGYNIRRGCN